MGWGGTRASSCPVQGHEVSCPDAKDHVLLVPMGFTASPPAFSSSLCRADKTQAAFICLQTLFALFAALCRTFVSSKERNLDHGGGIQTLVKKSRVFFPRGKQLNSSVPLAPLPWEPFGPSSLPQLLSIFQISWWKRRLGLDTPN